MAFTIPVKVSNIDTIQHTDASGTKLTTSIVCIIQAGGTFALAGFQVGDPLLITLVGGVPAGVAINNLYVLSIG